MQQQMTRSYEQTLEINRVLRNTYLLLGLSLVLAAATAGFAVVTNAAPVGFIWLLVGWFGLSFLTMRLRNSGWGLIAMFAFAAFTGYTVGPVINGLIHAYSNGAQIVMAALGTTGFIFLGLSIYALSTRKDFSYMGGFIAAAAMTAFIVGIGAVLFGWPMIMLVVSGAFALISSAFILYHTSAIIHGGERNYVMATIGIYIAIFNLFISLLNIFTALAGNRN